MKFKQGNATLTILPDGPEPGGAGGLYLTMLVAKFELSQNSRVDVSVTKVEQPAAEECFDDIAEYMVSITHYQEGSDTVDHDTGKMFDNVGSALVFFKQSCDVVKGIPVQDEEAG